MSPSLPPSLPPSLTHFTGRTCAQQDDDTTTYDDFSPRGSFDGFSSGGNFRNDRFDQMGGPLMMMPPQPMAPRFELYFTDDGAAVVVPRRPPPPSFSFFRVFFADSPSSLRGADDAPPQGDDMPCHHGHLSCATDLAALCPNEAAIKGDALGSSFYQQMCLMRHRPKLSGSCLGFLSSQEENLVSQCSADIDGLCPDVEPGSNRIHSCLWEQKQSLSASCREQLSKSRPRVVGSDDALAADRGPAKDVTGLFSMLEALFGPMDDDDGDARGQQMEQQLIVGGDPDYWTPGTKGQPAKPAKEPPTKEPPTKEPLTKEPPTKEPLTKEPLTQELLTKEPPAKEPLKGVTNSVVEQKPLAPWWGDDDAAFEQHAPPLGRVPGIDLRGAPPREHFGLRPPSFSASEAAGLARLGGVGGSNGHPSLDAVPQAREAAAVAARPPSGPSALDLDTTSSAPGSRGWAASVLAAGAAGVGLVSLVVAGAVVGESARRARARRAEAEWRRTFAPALLA